MHEHALRDSVMSLIGNALAEQVEELVGEQWIEAALVDAEGVKGLNADLAEAGTTQPLPGRL